MKIQLGSFSIPRSLTYVPYSANMLESYIKNHDQAPDCDFLPPVWDYDQKPEPGVDILGLTCYVWCQDHVDQLAMEYKKENPNSVIVYGGPNIPVSPSEWLEYEADRPYVDIFVAGSGEEIFLQLLQEYPNFTQKWYKLQKDGKYRYDTPTPYVDGTMDYFLNHPTHEFCAILETNRGCPFKCAYCDWGDATGSVVSKYDDDVNYQTLDLIMKSKAMKGIKIIDANWGMYERDLEMTKYMRDNKRDDVFVSLCGTAKNSIKYVPEISKIFFKDNFAAENGHWTPLKIGVQSWSKKTLAYNDRSNIKTEQLEYLLNYYKENDIPYHSELIVGLPGETPDSWLYTLDKDFSHGVESQAFHALEAVPNMPLLLNHRQEYELEVWKAYAARDDIHSSGNKAYHKDRTVVYNDFDIVKDKWDIVAKDLIRSCFSFTKEELLTIYDYTWWMNTFSNTKLLTDIQKPSIDILTFFDNLDNMPFWREQVMKHRMHWHEAMVEGKIRSIGGVRYWFHTMFRADEMMCVAENFEQAQDELGRKLTPFKRSLRAYDYDFNIKELNQKTRS